MFSDLTLFNMSLSLTDFKRRSIMKQRPYDILEEAELLDPPGGSRLRLRFGGPFEGRNVTWEAILIALAADGRSVQRNFIDIGEAGENGIPLTVGLNVRSIDLPTVRKAMMMIRQYKRLRRGRHEYGPGAPAGG
jgi:hypothetical protein